MDEVIITGGSYAGLSAAVALGRARRRVLVLDAGRPRNRFTPHTHNLLLHNGNAPADLTARARRQVAAYPAVQLSATEAFSARQLPGNGFEVATSQGTYQASRLLATGMRNELPPVPGFAECWGKSVIHCSFCHGYEVADQPTGIWNNGPEVSHQVRMLLNWTRELTVFTNGPATFDAAVRALLAANRVLLEETPVAALLHRGGQLTGLRLADGREQPLPVLYARLPSWQASDLGCQLGCQLTEQQQLRVEEGFRTTVPGVWAAGDFCAAIPQLALAIAAGNLVEGTLSRELIFGS